MKSSKLDKLFRLFLILILFFFIFSGYIIIAIVNKIINTIEEYKYHKENINERYSIEEKM